MWRPWHAVGLDVKMDCALLLFGADLKEELHESAYLGVEECRQANDLKRRNAELERELQEIKTFSPSSAGSASDWRWVDDRRSLRKRASATSSEGGLPGGLRKKAMAAQFDEDLDEFMRENAELKEQVSRAEKAKRELEEKLREVEMEKPVAKSSPPAGQLKAGLQVQHKAREINWERMREELRQEVETEKLQVTALKDDMKKIRKQAAVKEEKFYQELQEERASRMDEFQEAQRSHEQDLKRLRKDLEAARFQLLATNFRGSPGLAPPSPGGERLNSILSARSDDGEPSPFDFDTGTGNASLADELSGHFQWPTGQDALQYRLPEEINALRVELQQMQFAQEGGAEAEQALVYAKAEMKAEAQEVRGLRKEIESFEQRSARAPEAGAAEADEEVQAMLSDGIRRQSQLEGKLQTQRQEIASLKTALGDKASLLDKEAELQALHGKLKPHGGIAKVLQSVKELGAVQQEVSSLRKAAADAERFKAEVAELKRGARKEAPKPRSELQELKREISELESWKADLEGRRLAAARETEEVEQAKPQAAPSQRMIQAAQDFGPKFAELEPLRGRPSVPMRASKLGCT
eukprot:s830_g8.t1